MHILIAGPIAGEDVRRYLDAPAVAVPQGYRGAPLTAILIGELLALGHRVTGLTTDAALPLEGGAVALRGSAFHFVACPARPRAWRFNGRHPGRALDQFAFERRALAAAMIEAAPDIVHAHWSYEFALAALEQPAPHLITCHDLPATVLRHHRNAYRAVRYMMARRVFLCGREFSAVSSYVARALSARLGHLPPVVPNPVASLALALGRTRRRGATQRVAMVCNAWDRLKNPEPALRAFAQWRLVTPYAELHLFGADFGPGGVAQRWASAQGVTQGLSFRGRLPHIELLTALAEMDALMHPSLEESFGVVLAEAMALGLPIVAGRESGAVPAVLGSDGAGITACGVLVDVTSATAICNGLSKAFDEDYPERSRACLERARSEYSSKAVTHQYLAVYDAVLSVPQANGARRRLRLRTELGP